MRRRQTVGGVLPDGFALFFVRAAYFVLKKLQTKAVVRRYLGASIQLIHIAIITVIFIIFITIIIVLVIDRYILRIR